jgi:putative addiction module component (TIGR02574 family)
MLLANMTLTEIRKLPIKEKLHIMEVLWEDLRSQVQEEPVPDWHKELLDNRRKAVEAGHEKVLDWDQVKDSIGKRRA